MESEDFPVPRRGRSEFPTDNPPTVLPYFSEERVIGSGPLGADEDAVRIQHVHVHIDQHLVRVRCRTGCARIGRRDDRVSGGTIQ